ncbi:MAG TPA: hypothetical protein VNB22_08145 [Pyrinomonadaceae bacterium]|jgi:hypothetical protein|nr:hypothetical protein [Pyrinomonadaceae bacterium]
MRRKLTVTLLTSLILFSFWQLTVNVSAQQPLTLAMILTGLQTKGKTPETATLPKRNLFITRKVETYGVTFRLTPEIEKELRIAGASTVLIAAIRENGPSATPTPTQRTTSSTPSASFKELWVDYGVTEGGENGMRIHVKFTAYGMKNLDSYLAIYFMDEDGNYLKDNNRKFTSSSGDVAVYRDLKPGYDPAEYADYSVFMPYSELDLPNGNWDLQMDVKLIYKAGGLISQLTKKPFNYKKGDTVTRNSAGVTFKVTRVWVDYNVTEGSVRGMRVHVNFEVTGLKGVDSKLVARVQKESGDYVLNSSSDYSNNDGQLQIEFSMKPGYETTVYKDADMFLPYSAINVSRGKWDLKLDIDLNYEDGELIKHLSFYDFEFERP